MVLLIRLHGIADFGLFTSLIDLLLQVPQEEPNDHYTNTWVRLYMRIKLKEGNRDLKNIDRWRQLLEMCYLLPSFFGKGQLNFFVWQA